MELFQVFSPGYFPGVHKHFLVEKHVTQWDQALLFVYSAENWCFRHPFLAVIWVCKANELEIENLFGAFFGFFEVAFVEILMMF